MINNPRWRTITPLLRDPATDTWVCGTDSGVLVLVDNALLGPLAEESRLERATYCRGGIRRIIVPVPRTPSKKDEAMQVPIFSRKAVDLHRTYCYLSDDRVAVLVCGHLDGHWYVRDDTIAIVPAGSAEVWSE